MSEAVFPRILGNYVLLRPLAQGGMGDLLLARHDGAAGIKKFCVVKTLRAHLHGDREYVKRFIDEATVVVQLSHRNICQVYDVGKSDENIFLVMEHITGFDLGTVRERAEQKGTPLSRAISIHVVGEMLEALDYAHRHIDALSGRPLGLVHRDVSPHNAMLNGEGEVKLIDFGLAATGVQLSEEAGSSMVMGKLSYMAPEHARGELIDGRADQFSSAVVLYELLTGARYYGGMSPKQVWAIAGMGTHVAPLLDEFPGPLQAILKRALAPEPSERYASCGDFREALATYAYDHHLRVTTRDVRELMVSLFADELGAIRKMLQDQANVSLDVHKPPQTERFERIATTVHGLSSSEPTEFINALGRAKDTPTTSVIRADAFERRTSRTRLGVAAVLGAAVIVSALLVFVLIRATASDDITVTTLPDLPPPVVGSAPAPTTTAAPSRDAVETANAPPPAGQAASVPPTSEPAVVEKSAKKPSTKTTSRKPRRTGKAAKDENATPPTRDKAVISAHCLSYCTTKVFPKGAAHLTKAEFEAAQPLRDACQRKCEKPGS